MKDYFKIHIIKNEMKETYRDAVEMYAFIVKYNKESKDWQRALECLIELNNCLECVLTISKRASLERKNLNLVNIYLKDVQEYRDNYNNAFAALFEMVVNIGGNL